MKRFVLLAATAAAVTMSSPAAHASWVSENCFTDRFGVDSIKRSEARAYAQVAMGEGYEYAGGCWNNNDRDDTPNAPDSNGEGPDCSGLVFKSWRLKIDFGQLGIHWYNKFDNVHGPYGSTTFHSAPSGVPFFNIAKTRSITMYMDAFAKNGHIGLIWTNVGTSANNDYIGHAHGDEAGTEVSLEDYRSDSAYTAVRRKGWTADCAPQCGGPDTGLTVAVVS